MRSIVLVVLVQLLACAGLHLSVRAPWASRGHTSMRGKLGGAAAKIRMQGQPPSESSGGSELGSKIGKFFGTNRDTAEAQANQREWAREQMNMEMPDQTLDGTAIQDRQDLIDKCKPRPPDRRSCAGPFG